MIYLSELFPNPAGKDIGNEWIEVCNNGLQPQSLAGWKLQDASGKTFTIGNVSVVPQSCAVFGNTETKISLNNDAEMVSLFDANGVLIDKVSYNKAVKDDQALARASAGGELQITTTPTKGEIGNKIVEPQAWITKNPPSSRRSGTTAGEAKSPTTEGAGTPVVALGQKTVLVSGTSLWEPILIGVCVAGVLAAVFVKVVAQLKQKTENKK